MTAPGDYTVRANIQAWQVSETNYADVAEWCDGTYVWDEDPSGTHAVMLDTPTGTAQVPAGDWVIKGATGLFFRCDPETFGRTYEEVT